MDNMLGSERRGIRARTALTSKAWLELHSSRVMIVGTILLVLYRIALMNELGAPSGSDGGNWLALASELFGKRTKAAFVPYPPIIPLVLRGLLIFFPPLVALTILGAVASASLVPPVYYLLREGTGGIWAPPLALAFAFFSLNVEMAAWGAYPQLASQGLVLSSLVFLAYGLRDDDGKRVVVSAWCAGIAIGTSVFAVPQLAMAAPALGAALAARTRTRWRRMAGGLGLWVIACGMFSLPYVPAYIWTLRLSAGKVWNPHGYTWETSNAVFKWVFRELPPFFHNLAVWFILAVGLTAYCLFVRRRSDPLAASAVSLILPSLALFIATFEPRTLSLFQVGLGLALVTVATDLWTHLRARHGAGPSRLLVLGPFGTAVVLLAVGLTVSGHVRTVVARNWFQVLDSDIVEALDWLKRHGRRGDLVVASEGARDVLYGWWIEGYAGLRTYMVTPPGFLAFREERAQAAVAAALLKSSSPGDIARRSMRYGVTYLFLDRDLYPDLSRFTSAGYVVEFSNKRITILRWTFALLGPRPPWWPERGLTEFNVLEVSPPAPEGPKGAYDSYYRYWYLLSRLRLGLVLGYSSRDIEVPLLRALNAASAMELWREIGDLKSALRSGVVGDPRYPEYHYKLWLSMGRPSAWREFRLDCRIAKGVSVPPPPFGVRSRIFREFYACERARLAVVYTGEPDQSLTPHLRWAEKYSDAELYWEITLLRRAYREGVRGSRLRPFVDFSRWLARQRR